jgi:dolichol kinase
LIGCGIFFAKKFFGGYALHILEDRFHLSRWIENHLRDNFEVRRQTAHLFIGLALLLLLQWHLITPGILLGILCLGGLLSLLSLRWKLPGIQPILDTFDRPHHRKTFPGQGSFFLVLGVLLSILIFPEPIALASIAIMALGDSVTNVFGRYFGEVRLPYNRKKTVDGVLIGIGAATLGALFFVPFSVALMASTVAMFVETLDLKIGVPIDDNLLVPIVAGGVMLVMGA